MKSFLNKYFLHILGSLIILYVGFKLWRKPTTLKTEYVSSSVQSKPIETVAVSAKPINSAAAAESIQNKRNQARDRMVIGTRTFKPTITSKGMQVTFEIHPTGRACQNGDIDLIKSVVGENGNLLLVVEDQKDNTLAKTSMTAAQLKTKISVPISIKVSDKLQLFRLSICSDGRKDTCKNITPIDFKKIENLTVKGSGPKQLKNEYLFYTYSFGAFEGGIHLFDSTQERNPQQYRKYLTSHAGNETQFDFLKSTLSQENKLGVVPVQIKENRMILPLYYNDKSVCEVSLATRVK